MNDIKYRVQEINDRFIIEEGWGKRIYLLGIIPTFKKKMVWQRYCTRIPYPTILGLGCITYDYPPFTDLNKALDKANEFNNPKPKKEPKYHYPNTI